MLMAEFMRHCEEKLAPKTLDRYHQQSKYLHPVLLDMPIPDITPLHLTREWDRLLKSGGHHRKTKLPRPLAAKTVRNIAGIVSSAFARAIRWRLVATNPVTNSEPPRVKKHLAIALTPTQQNMLLEAASGPWCMRTYLEIDAATGCRRGELLALRWSDIVDDCAIIARSLTQTRSTLEFKGTKTEKPRVVVLPASAITALASHRRKQDEFRRQFGPSYRADLDLVFANRDGTPLKPDSISATVSALFKRLKIPKPKGAALHLLRHTHTSVLLAEGVPLAAVSARLGHSSVRTTQEIYAHMITGQDEEAARKWEAYQKLNRPAAAENRKENV
jgi:integrase